MNKMITFQADEKLDRSIDEECELSGLSRDELLTNMINRQLLRRSFWRLRKKMVPLGKASGYFTDEDVFHDFK
jgi:hypothetical protein